MSELKEYRPRSRLYIVGDESENEDENTHKGVVCLQNLIYGTIFTLIVYRLIGTMAHKGHANFKKLDTTF